MTTAPTSAALPIEGDILAASQALWAPYAAFMGAAIDRLEATTPNASARVSPAGAPRARQPLRPGLWTGC